MNQKKQNVSMSVIRRLPRYYRFLSELGKNGATRISSKELSEKMGFTASQIRQDFNCFGGFGQQGYGYNVSQLCGRLKKSWASKSATPAFWWARATWARPLPGTCPLSSWAFPLSVCLTTPSG